MGDLQRIAVPNGGEMIENRSMDVPELLHHAADLVPAHARSDAGLSVDEVRDYIRDDEWEVALGILEDFDGIHWQTTQYWDLLIAAGKQMWLDSDVSWFQWRRSETLYGLIRADLQLVPPDAGGRRCPVPSSGKLRPMWSIGQTTADGHPDLHIAFIWVESAPQIPPGGQGPIRLLPLTPSPWRHLKPGDMITMHERQPVTGTATIIEIQRPWA